MGRLGFMSSYNYGEDDIFWFSKNSQFGVLDEEWDLEQVQQDVEIDQISK